ncbi:hypothetical protein FT641_18755 [Bacillus paranthracis]|uniref:hypothetical protein n=1 Tax=Bacillus paranthracis TaxID=2026186 RepID=UPI001879DFED|nr:hypothetical protein [Bacillus paranthracis]MBE7114395.1 hypothetical protein [Bacillus paranthracis]MBE7154732.1 hypothetical protein [Bacillus paranthracis]
MYGYGGRDAFGSVAMMKIKCPAGSGCEYIHDFEHTYTDFSPRFEGVCPRCKGSFSTKVSRIDKSKIVSREVESNDS